MCVVVFMRTRGWRVLDERSRASWISSRKENRIQPLRMSLDKGTRPGVLMAGTSSAGLPGVDQDESRRRQITREMLRREECVERMLEDQDLCGAITWSIPL